MKRFVKKILKTLFVTILAIFVLYFSLTLRIFCQWCDYNQIDLFKTSDVDSRLNMDPEKVEDIGNYVTLVYEMYEQGKEDSPYKDDLEGHSMLDGHEHTFGDFYDPMGLAVIAYVDGGLSTVANQYIGISIFVGIGIGVAYTVITCKKINNLLKIAIGYFGVILIIPPLYMYSWTYRFWSLSEMYGSISKWFYIGYTAIFALIYTINYISGKKMANDLNEVINNK